MESVAWMQNKWTFCTNAVVEQQVEIKVSLLVPGSAVLSEQFIIFLCQKFQGQSCM